MCIDIGYTGTGENSRARYKCVYRTAVYWNSTSDLKKEQNLLCHSQLDGSQGCVAMICYY